MWWSAPKNRTYRRSVRNYLLDPRLQLRVTAGYAAVDRRELQPGHTVELDTPGAAFTMERAGYYHAEVAADTTTFRTHRGGTATMTPSGGAATPVVANQQVVVSGGEAPRVETGAAALLSAWDRWNYQRSDYLIQPASAKYVPAGVYGGDALDQHGSWRTVETYGSVWVPAGVPAGWSPYTTGRWIWDPRFGWTWLDEAPWGWAPYHYGRWVFVARTGRGPRARSSCGRSTRPPSSCSSVDRWWSAARSTGPRSAGASR